MTLWRAVQSMTDLPSGQKAMDESYTSSFAVTHPNARRKLMFTYWGTRGSLPLLTRELARVAAARTDISCTFSISTSNELFSDFAFLGDDLLAVDTFLGKGELLLTHRRVRTLRSRLGERLAADRTRAVISLMPHVLSPLIAPVIRRAGVKYVAVVHDADAHPGDHYGIINWWLLREAIAADRVITLSNSVARRLTAARHIPEDKIRVLFHPDLNYGRAAGTDEGHAGPLRILFFGRIFRYKGLHLLIEAAEILRKSGVPLKLGVFGQGEINAVNRRRLSSLDAQVENRWIGNAEMQSILSRYDLVVAAHTEASQSGVISAALGSGLPVVATPVGGLVEQIAPDVTGIIAEAPTAPALAAAIRRVADDRVLLARMRRAVATTGADRSTERFFQQICEIALS